MKTFLTTTALAAICILGSIQVTTASPLTTEPSTATENYTLQIRGGGHGGGGHSFGGSRGDFGADHGALGGDRGEVARHEERNLRRDEGYYGDYGYGDMGYGDIAGDCTDAFGNIVPCE